MTVRFDCVSFAYRRGRSVLRDLSLNWHHFPLAVLGPNGAGKSSLLSVVAGIQQPRTGAVTLDGATAGHRHGTNLRDRRRLVGFAPQDVSAAPGLTVAEQVAYAGWLKGMNTPAAKRAARSVLESVDLADLSDRRASQLSGGQRRRLGIAQAMVHRPRYLVLDEPHAGLDPEQRSRLRDVIRTVATTTEVIVSTHQTEDLSAMYREVLVLADGQARFQGSVAELWKHADGGDSDPTESAYISILRSAA